MFRNTMAAAALAIAFSSSTEAYAGNWEYTTETDPMTSKTEKRAVLRSNNSLRLPFPYTGPNHGRLIIRQHPRYGVDAIVDIDKGQILCRSYQSCTVQVRFDDAKPSAFSAIGPADNSTDTVFIQNSSRFITAAKKAKRILVSITFYQAGDQVLEFVADEPLQWEQRAKPSPRKSGAVGTGSPPSAGSVSTSTSMQADQAKLAEQERARRQAYVEGLIKQASRN